MEDGRHGCAMDAKTSSQFIGRIAAAVRRCECLRLVTVEPNLGLPRGGTLAGSGDDVALTSSFGKISSPALGFE
jgi:hypothetical protein